MKNKSYQASTHKHLAEGQTNRADGAWENDHKNREGLRELIARHQSRNARNAFRRKNKTLEAIRRAALAAHKQAETVQSAVTGEAYMGADTPEGGI